MINGLFAAGARAVALDIIFSYPANRFAAIDPRYDKPLLAALAQHRGRVVLARTVGTPVAAPFVAAVFDPVHDVGREEPGAIAYSERTRL